MKKIFTTLSVFAILLSGNMAMAQGETCATAINVTTGTYTSDGPTTGNGASAYSGDVHSDWYSFTATQDGVVTISSCGSGGDTRLFGFTGTCGALTNVFDNDDDCSANETASYAITTGEVLYFEWSDAYDNTPVTFTVTLNTVTAGGEDCASAIAVTEGTYTSDGPTTGNGASTYSGDTSSDWYSYTATQDGLVTISSCGSGSDTRLYGFTGSCGTLTNVIDNDDDCNANESASYIISTGEVLYFEWTDAYDTAPVNFTVSFGSVTAGGDNCATATAVTEGTYTSDGPATGNGASTYSGDTNSDWFSFTAPTDGLLTISSCGSGNNSRLYGFTGTCGTLANVIDSDDECGSNESATYSMTSGETVYFEWTDAFSSTGVIFDVTFSIEAVGGDDCANAVEVNEGVTYTSDGPTAGNGASTYSGDTNSDWYYFIPSTTDSYTISSCGSGNDTKLFVFDGTCGTLNNIADRDDDCNVNEEVTLLMTSGTTYYIEWSDSYSTDPVTFSITGPSASLENETLNEVNIYPNPTFDGIFSIDFEGAEDSSSDVKIVNSLGRIVYESGKSALTKIDISEQPAGIYFVIINSNGVTSTRKLVKK